MTGVQTCDLPIAWCATRLQHSATTTADVDNGHCRQRRVGWVRRWASTGAPRRNRRECRVRPDGGAARPAAGCGDAVVRAAIAAVSGVAPPIAVASLAVHRLVWRLPGERPR